MTYGYARISTKQQSIDRQTRNIKSAYPDAHVEEEAYTGTKIDRPVFDKLLRQIDKDLEKGKPVTLVFDSVSRMSRNAEDGYKLYQKLYGKGVNLVFLKEPHINTATYDKAKQNSIPTTGTKFDKVIEAINDYIADLAKEQIELAFAQAQKEVDDLHERTREGIQTARLNGKQIGGKTGAKLNIKKAAPAKAIIKQHSKDFGGTLNDAECMKLAGLARNTYYKYKRELKEEQ
ncbi:recombinase family protein [Faecalibacterium sp. AF27-11BH]|jgi:DNA invertase Pin-like site-specific DNA recombinase|uniref:recombinase family protein n=1 Tax=Faecalibacterium sp. AF27-11BH TaxID=2302956 RepID=UPI000E71802E|nr:recombinase family protein [Faecalibacterium sp. AF27-11BH]RJV78449.1 recombinase family protein [Faecalibacterium sp. AF27-11BH]